MDVVDDLDLDTDALEGSDRQVAALVGEVRRLRRIRDVADSLHLEAMMLAGSSAAMVDLTSVAMSYALVRNEGCMTCTDDLTIPFDECPQSKWACGHHSNDSWDHACCPWCGWEAPG